MIYIKNIKETQTIFIPRNELQKEAFNATVKTYEDGYKDGFNKGEEEQKKQLLNLYVTSNGVYERNDGFGTVTVDIPLEGDEECNCDEAYQEGFNDGVNSVECEECNCDEAYNDGYNQGYNDGQENCQGGDCEGVEFFNDAMSLWMYLTENNVENFSCALKGTVQEIYDFNNGKLSYKIGEGWEQDAIVVDGLNINGEEFFTDWNYQIKRRDTLIVAGRAVLEEGVVKIYDSQIWLNDKVAESKQETFTANGSYVLRPSNDYEAIKQVYVTVDVPSGGGVSGELNEFITENGSYEYIPSNYGYDTFSKVNIDANLRQDAAKIYNAEELMQKCMEVEGEWITNVYLRGVISDVQYRESSGLFNFSIGDIRVSNCRNIGNVRFEDGSALQEGYEVVVFGRVRYSSGTFNMNTVQLITLFVCDGEGGSCNLQDGWFTPSVTEKDDNGFIIYQPQDGYDGFSRTVIDLSTIESELGGQGGSAECNLGVLDVSLTSPYTEVFSAKDRDGVDGYEVVIIRCEDMVQQQREEAKQETLNTLPSVTFTQNGSYGVDHYTDYKSLQFHGGDNYLQRDSNLNQDFEIIVTYSFGDNITDKMNLVEIGPYGVTVEWGMCFGTKNGEKISPSHMSWGNETINSLRITKDGIHGMKGFAGDSIEWGEQLSDLSTIKIGRNFLGKIIDISINGEKFEPKEDGTFDGFNVVGQRPSYDILSIQDYPKGFRNVEINVPTIENIFDYRYTPIGIKTAFADRMFNFKLNYEGGFYDEYGEVLSNDDVLFVPSPLNNGEIRTKKMVKEITSLPYDTSSSSPYAPYYLTFYTENNYIKNHTFSNLSVLHVDENVQKLRFTYCSFPQLYKIMIEGNLSDFEIDGVKRTDGVIQVKEDNDNIERYLSRLPSGWTVEYI